MSQDKAVGSGSCQWEQTQLGEALGSHPDLERGESSVWGMELGSCWSPRHGAGCGVLLPQPNP